MTASDAVWDAAVDALAAAETICVVGHVRPDGDALGAMIGLAHAARAAGKEAVASFGEPFVVGAEFEYLDQSVLVPPGDIPEALDLTVVCDTGVLSRIGSAASAVERSDRLLVVDHHKTESDLDGIALIDPTAAATTQIVFGLLERLGWPITAEVAEALYTGIVTDTGRFMYSSTTGDVHRITAELLDAGVEPAPIGQQLYERAPFGYFSVVAAVLGRAELDRDAGLVWSVLTPEDIAAAGISWEAADGLIDLVRLAVEADTALLLKEVEPGTFKGSLRSRGAVDVSAIAGSFGGGGHHNAAGFTAEAGAEEIVTKISEQLR